MFSVGLTVSPPMRIGKKTVVIMVPRHSSKTFAAAPQSLGIRPIATTSGQYYMRPRAYTPRLGCLMFSTRAPNRPQAPMRRALTVAFRGLPFDADREEVEGFFSRCGRVVRAKLRAIPYVREAATGYVQFASQESVDRALALNDREILGRQMYVHALFELTDTVTIGCLPLGVDKNRVKAFFSSCGKVIDIKIHTSLTGEATGQCYGFVRFASPTSSSEALKLNRTPFAGRPIVVQRAEQRAEDVSIWDNYAETDEWMARSINVSGLPPQVNEDQLKAEFETYGEISLARVWRQLGTGNSLGFGFVRFSSPESVAKALDAAKTIAGQHLHLTRVSPIRPAVLDYVPPPVEYAPTRSIFIGRLAHDVDDTQLRRTFERFGKITRVLVVRHLGHGNSRGCGYVDFSSPDAVERAVQHDSTLKINGFTVKILRNYTLPKSKRDVASSIEIDGRDPYESYRKTGSWEDDY
ncbi:hypothetical protein PENSPDRAFT_652811 [Peniophora sp. CONT]|nr:hypothetical protein PENSPDRAFT_652811 [Peniophora sp. CONT]